MTVYVLYTMNVYAYIQTIFIKFLFKRSRSANLLFKNCMSQLKLRIS